MQKIKLVVMVIIPMIFSLSCKDGAYFYVGKIFAGHNPSEIVIQSRASYSRYVTITNDDNVFVETDNTQSIKVGIQPVGIALWQKGDRFYVMNNGGLSISVIATSNNMIIDSITDNSFHNMGDAVVTPDGSLLYVATDTNAISIISTATDAVLQTFTDPSFEHPAHLIADVFDRYIFVSESDGNAVSVISTTTNTVLKTIGVGLSPNGMAETTDGNWLFVVNSGSNSISVINVGSLSLARTVTDTSFDNPQRIVLTPDCAYGFVSEYNSGNISLISQNALITGSGRAVVKDVYGGIKPYDLAIDDRGSSFPSVTAILKGENAITDIEYIKIYGVCS